MTLSLTHLVREPSAKSGRPAPLLVLLHGVGSNERDLMGLAPELDERFFVVSARAPITLQPGSYAWFHVQFTADGPVIIPDEAEDSRKKVLAFVDELVRDYPVDPRQVYLMGFSQGCIMSLAAALTEPKKFAGVVGMSGRLLPEVVPKMAPAEDLKGLPLLIVHGTYDNVLPIANGRGIRDQLQMLPVELEYKEYTMAHHVTPESLADIRDWLKRRLNGRA